MTVNMPESSAKINQGTVGDLSVLVFDDLKYLPFDVQSAIKKAESLDIEQGLEWIVNIVENVFANNCITNIFVLYKDDCIKAVLPIKIVDGKISALGNFYTSLYQPYLSRDLAVAELSYLIRKIFESYPSAESICFSPMDPSWFGFSHLQSALKQSGLFEFSYFCFGNWYHRTTEGWENYFKGRPGQTRSTIKRKSKEFLSAGGLLDFCWDDEKLEYGINSFVKVYAASWKVPEPFPNFMPGLMKIMAQRGCLRLAVASLNGKPIAAQLWIVANGKASIFKLAYHEEYKKYSAGTLLTAKLMEYVLDVDKVKELDYLIGDDPYKASWMTQRRERWGIISFNPRTVIGFLLLIKETGGRIVKKLLRKSQLDSPGQKVLEDHR